MRLWSPDNATLQLHSAFGGGGGGWGVYPTDRLWYVHTQDIGTLIQGLRFCGPKSAEKAYT